MHLTGPEGRSSSALQSPPSPVRRSGRPAMRSMAFGAALVGAIVLASLHWDGWPSGPPSLGLDTGVAVPGAEPTGGAHVACYPPAFHEPDGSVAIDPAILRMNSNSYRWAAVCGPSVLTLRVEGSAVDGIGARLVVAWRDRALFDEAITGEDELRLEVPGEGWLLLAFVNDLYRPPLDRNLVLHDVRLAPRPEAPP